MFKLLNLIFLFVQIIQGFEYCNNPNRCLSVPSINCEISSEVPTDRLCCPGSSCEPIFIPATDTQDALNTTWCVPSSNSIETNRYGNFSKVAPIMAEYWQAKTTYYNMSNGDTGWGEIFYDATLGALRIDFNPMCPFLQLYELGVDANYIPCTVLFLQGLNYFIYPDVEICCVYKFPVWNPDWLCASNATFGGSVDIDGIMTDLWEVEWFSNYTGEGPVINIRNIYMQVDSNVPLRLREDLDTGFLDFHDYQAIQPDSSVFYNISTMFPCHHGYIPGINPDKTCTRYNSQDLRRSWPCSTPTCNVNE